MNDYLDTNRALWDGWTKLHTASAFYNVNGFKAGHSTLKPVERDELGDVSGKTLLHLQCHFGLDTLSWAREGAFVTLEYLHEFSYSTYPFPWYLDEEQPDRYVWKDRTITVPLMFSIKATR